MGPFGRDHEALHEHFTELFGRSATLDHGEAPRNFFTGSSRLLAQKAEGCEGPNIAVASDQGSIWVS